MIRWFVLLVLVVPSVGAADVTQYERAYERSAFQAAVMEDGSRVEIVVDRHGKVSAYKFGKAGRKLLVPDGHYELLNGTLTLLEPNNYALTNDASVLFSVRKGKVINYLPKWGVDLGDFEAFDVKSP